jgi:acyl-coenzyme A thioesterase PaaI-like protein
MGLAMDVAGLNGFIERAFPQVAGQIRVESLDEVALAVTTNASIDFMRKPQAGRDLLAECRILKLGRQLAVGDCLIRSEGQPEPVARCSMTYAIPPGRG